jgi:hypothetical protein
MMKTHDLILKSKPACLILLLAAAFAGAAIVAGISMPPGFFCVLASCAALCGLASRSVAIADFHRSISYPQKVKPRDAFLDRSAKEGRAL